MIDTSRDKKTSGMRVRKKGERIRRAVIVLGLRDDLAEHEANHVGRMLEVERIGLRAQGAMVQIRRVLDLPGRCLLTPLD